jgi:hypothetical protein
MSFRRGRAWLAGALALALVGVAVFVVRRDDGGGPAPAGAYAPAPERRFAWVGTTTRQQFTDEEFRILARDYGVVVLSKFHAGFRTAAHHEAARRLVALHPGIQVYPYWSTKYWFDKERAMGLTFDPDWYLRDNRGELVIRTKRGEERSKYVDLANPAYREWALEVLAGWLRAAPYAGVAFDAAEPIGDFGADDVQEWDRLLGPARIEAYNDGMRDLLRRAHELVGPDRKIIYNGFAPNPRRGPGRNLDLLELTDGALTERFCIGARGEPVDIAADLEVVRDHPGKALLFKSNHRDTFGARARYERLCFGAFLLGWDPGRTYFQFGPDYTEAQLTNPAPDLDVNVGRPVGDAVVREGLGRRDFANGIVLVNLADEPRSTPAPRALAQLSGRHVVDRLGPGDTITVPPQDAVFLLDPALAT